MQLCYQINKISFSSEKNYIPRRSRSRTEWREHEGLIRKQMWARGMWLGPAWKWGWLTNKGGAHGLGENRESDYLYGSKSWTDSAIHCCEQRFGYPAKVNETEQEGWTKCPMNFCNTLAKTLAAKLSKLCTESFCNLLQKLIPTFCNFFRKLFDGSRRPCSISDSQKLR